MPPLRQKLDQRYGTTTRDHGHTHRILSNGMTSADGKGPHTHTWKRGDKRTSKVNGHTHGFE